MSEILGQSGHALPNLQQPVCANFGSGTGITHPGAAHSPLNRQHSGSHFRLLTEHFISSLVILTYFALMDERRVAPRSRVVKAGTIEFDGGAITCIVRDLSISGAALDVTSSANIPERFTLSFRADADGLHMPCRLVWRKEDRIGVAFD